MRYWLGPHNQACSDPAPVEPAPALSAPEFVILLTTKQLEVDPGRSRAQPHSGLDRAVFHGRWDDRTQRQFSRVWDCVRLGAARLPVVRLSHSATCQNAPL
jgi:hypothetical protein